MICNDKEKATKRLTPIKAIRRKCLDCQGNSYISVRNCEDKNCHLYLYRLGKRPKITGTLENNHFLEKVVR